MSLARFYHTMAADKPRLLLLMDQLKDQSYKPLLKLWEERHTQPKGVYTGKTYDSSVYESLQRLFRLFKVSVYFC